MCHKSVYQLRGISMSRDLICLTLSVKATFNALKRRTLTQLIITHVKTYILMGFILGRDILEPTAGVPRQ